MGYVFTATEIQGAKAMTDQCPVCRQAMPELPLTWSKEFRTLVKGDHVVRFTVQQADIFHLLWNARRSGGINANDIAERIFSDREDGGPDTWTNVVHVSVCKIRKLVKPLGLKIPGSRGRGAFYNLEVDSGSRKVA